MFYKSIKKLRKNKIFLASTIYLFFSLLTQGVNLFYTPLLTRNLTQEDYGIYSLLYSIEGILSLLLLICIPSGYSRFYNEIDNKRDYENTIFNFLVLFGACILIIIYIIADKIPNSFLVNISDRKKYIFLIAISSYATGLISLLTIKYSMEFKAFKASTISFGQIFIQFIGLFLMIRIKIFNLTNIFYLKSLVPIFIFLIVFLVNVKNYRLKINRKYLCVTLSFSSGLILGQISTWVLALIDRQFINSYSGLEKVAIYSLAARIGMLINPVFIDPLRRIFTPIKFKVYDKKDGKKVILNYYKLYCFLGGFILLGMSIYSKTAIKILATEEYMKAIYIIPIIGISYFFWGLNEFYAVGVVIGNKSILNSFIAFSAAFINIIGNIFLIPIIGIYGAAISSIISYFITNELYYKFGKKYYFINFNRLEWIKFLTIYILFLFIYIYVCEKTQFNIYIEGFINIGYLIGYVIVNIVLKFIDMNLIREIRENEVV